ncbi:Oligoribonuclease [Acorus calamus]|uniref:Oligoribonuclease n=1 Tax=Acorus calamus TaxID=4465 RepID=A0AAV9ETM3_ACOCL|nr:Oligoribonuclease [Acorus calamus]
MKGVANAFSVLSLDAEDDKEQTTIPPASAAGSKSTKSDDGKVKVKMPSFKNGNDSGARLSTSLGEHKFPLVWIDLEMTGLDVEVDRILEIACIITDGKLTKRVEGPDLVICQPKECLDSMGEWCQEHHAASGLTEKVLHSTTSEQDAEKQVVEFVKQHVGTQLIHLAGNSVYMDYLFLKKYMPNLAGLFSHVLVDVSSVKALCARWFPKESKKAPSKENKHRAMDDIKESIKELKYLKDNIFKRST